jgi:hypothetical protein
MHSHLLTATYSSLESITQLFPEQSSFSAHFSTSVFPYWLSGVKAEVNNKLQTGLGLFVC